MVTGATLHLSSPRPVVFSGAYTLSDYAIVQTGGKQYRVNAGDVIRVETLPGDEGDVVELDDVRMLSLDGDVKIGTPSVPDAKVVAQIEASGRGKKIIIFKFKAKTRYRRKNGHRQPYTDLKITSIS
jgi:large subunit ribosomal protein L21